jgi:hypothetical protein
MATPKKVPDSKAVLKKSLMSWVRLFEYAEGQVDLIAKGKLTPSDGLLQTLFTIASETAERLPVLLADETKTKSRTSKVAAGNPKGFDGWSEDDEKDYLRDVSEDEGMSRDYLANPENSEDMKDLLRQFIQEFKENPPPPPPEEKRLRLP